MTLQSVINRTLSERQQLLKQAVGDLPPGGLCLGSSCVAARVAALLPDAPLFGGQVCSRVGRTQDDIQEAFDEAIRLQGRGGGGGLVCGVCPQEKPGFCVLPEEKFYGLGTPPVM